MDSLGTQLNTIPSFVPLPFPVPPPCPAGHSTATPPPNESPSLESSPRGYPGGPSLKPEYFDFQTVARSPNDSGTFSCTRNGLLIEKTAAAAAMTTNLTMG